MLTWVLNPLRNIAVAMTPNVATKKAAMAFLTEESRKFTLYGVGSGSFAGRPIPAAQAANLDGGIFLALGSISTQRKEFSPGKLLEQQGNKA